MYCLRSRSLHLAAFTLATVGYSGCDFDGNVVVPGGGGGQGGSPIGGGGSNQLGGGGEGGGGGLATCDVPKDCPAPSECRSNTCAEGVCGTSSLPAGTPLAMQMVGDCLTNICDGAGATGTEVDITDVPVSTQCTTATCSASGEVVVTNLLDGTPCGEGLECDGNGVCTGCQDAAECPGGPVCYTAACDAKVCSLVPVDAGQTAPGCVGVCQDGAYLGTCGQRLSSRTFPTAGGWTTGAVSSTWTGANAPPPTGIISAEETTSGSRLMVFRDDGMYYEFRAGAWKTPVPVASRFPFMTTPSAISATVSGRFVGSEDTCILTTNQNPPQAWSYGIPESDAEAVYQSGPGPVTDETLKANSPDQHTTTMDWAFGDQRAPYPTTPSSHVTFKGLVGYVYENWAGSNDFYYPFPELLEASSPLGLNNSAGAPAPNTTVAAFYREATSTVYLIGN